MDYNSELTHILYKSILVEEVLRRTPTLELPNWYLAAGMVAQTVWNYKHEFALDTGLKDCDLVYFDPDTSYEKEDFFIKRGNEIFQDLPIPVEIRNQARVHLWYRNKFGNDIVPYTSSEDSMTTWPTTATAVGVRKESYTDTLHICAPFGLSDVLNLTVRPNKALVTEKIYINKVARWKAVWPKLTMFPWND